MVPGTVELGGEDTGAGRSTENAQVEHEHELVDDGNTAHLHGADGADHDVIQQGNKIGNTVLDDDGDGYPQNPAVKGPVADVFLEHRKILDRSVI